MKNIKEAIARLTASGDFMQLKECVVDAVNSDNTADCTPADGSAPILAAMLQSVSESDSGLLIKPTLHSVVLVGVSDDDTAIVLAYDDIDSITLTFSDKLEINGGSNDGLIKIQELTDKLNMLVQAFNEHTHTVETSGTAAAQSGTAAPVIQPAQQFNKEDYEDNKITH